MEQENNSYFQEVKNNFSISAFINLIKLYFLGTAQEYLNEPILYLYMFEQLKLCNLSYIKEYEQKFRKYAILTKIDCGTPKSEGPIDQSSTCGITTLGHCALKSWYQMSNNYLWAPSYSAPPRNVPFSHTYSSIFTLQI